MGYRLLTWEVQQDMFGSMTQFIAFLIDFFLECI